MPDALLPVGTVVIVTPRPVTNLDDEIEEARPPYRAIVRGYDMHRSKYQLGRHLWDEEYADGGEWAPPSHVISLAATDVDDLQTLSNYLACAVGMLARIEARHEGENLWWADTLAALLATPIIVTAQARADIEGEDPAP
jgi:hypothetical protein